MLSKNAILNSDVYCVILHLFFQINRANSNDNESKLIIKTMFIFFSQKTAFIKMQLQMYNFRVKIKRVLV